MNTPKPHLHLISFDIPYPPNYGGVIVVFFTLKALHQKGIRVILHCFQYGNRQPSAELEQYCDEVHYYSRPLSIRYQLSRKPFITKTRMPKTLLQRLQQDEYPIWFESLHTCGFINHPTLAGRDKWVRMHNVEWEYYVNLFSLESNWFKSVYFLLESWKLRRFEQQVLEAAHLIFAISPLDQKHFEEVLEDKEKIKLLPPFHSNEKISSLTGKGAYAIFHGKLSVKDNEKAALYLVEEVFHNLDYPLIIAGANPSQKLQKEIAKYDHIQLRPNVSRKAMRELLQQAHIHILLSFQVAGMKLKLINSLFQGRFCIANLEMVTGTGLEELCRIYDSAEEIKEAVLALAEQEFTAAIMEKRRAVLLPYLSNEENIERVLQVIGV